MSKQIAVCLVAIAALAVAAQTAPAARQDTMKPQLVKTIVDKQLGRVLTTAGTRAIYVWNKEPKGKIRCTGACAKAWPPVSSRRASSCRCTSQGIKGDFGTIRRANGARQLTFNKRPLYTYAHEKPGQVLCNNVDTGSRSRCVRMRGKAPSETPVELRAYGRRTFLAVTGIGLSSLLWAKPVWQVVSGAAQPLQGALPSGLVPSSGWRIYTVAATMPRFDRTSWRLRIEGLVEQPVTLTYEELLAAAARGAGLGLPLRDRLVGEGRPLGRRSLPRPARGALGRARARACSRSSRPSARTWTR